MAPADPSESIRLPGRRVFDNRGQRVGRVADVVYDRVSSLPRWAVVDMGRVMRHRTAVPLREAHRSADGDLVVPFGRAEVRHAPRHGGGPVLTGGEERELRRY